MEKNTSKDVSESEAENDWSRDSVALRLVFTYLDARELCRVARVSRGWREAARDCGVWRGALRGALLRRGVAAGEVAPALRGMRAGGGGRDWRGECARACAPWRLERAMQAVNGQQVSTFRSRVNLVLHWKVCIVWIDQQFPTSHHIISGVVRSIMFVRLTAGHRWRGGRRAGVGGARGRLGGGGAGGAGRALGGRAARALGGRLHARAGGGAAGAERALGAGRVRGGGGRAAAGGGGRGGRGVLGGGGRGAAGAERRTRGGGPGRGAHALALRGDAARARRARRRRRAADARLERPRRSAQVVTPTLR